MARLETKGSGRLKEEETYLADSVDIEQFLPDLGIRSLSSKDCSPQQWVQLIKASLRRLHQDDKEYNPDREYRGDVFLRMGQIAWLNHYGMETFYDNYTYDPVRNPNPVLKNLKGAKNISEKQKFPKIRLATGDAMDESAGGVAYSYQHNKGERGTIFVNIAALHKEASDHFDNHTNIIGRRFPLAGNKGEVGYSATDDGHEFLEGLMMQAWHAYSRQYPHFWLGRKSLKDCSSLLEYDTQMERSHLYALLVQTLVTEQLVSANQTGTRRTSPNLAADFGRNFNMDTVTTLWKRADNAWNKLGLLGAGVKGELEPLKREIDTLFVEKFHKNPDAVRKEMQLAESARR